MQRLEREQKFEQVADLKYYALPELEAQLKKMELEQSRLDAADEGQRPAAMRCCSTS
jgi:hypothetical protein